ncbi:MAG: hypothetical protein GVY10_10680 [Verrucomicrobia bacterium]|nr:hypothetical protein [Verrucomicrobiota bacterium]
MAGAPVAALLWLLLLRWLLGVWSFTFPVIIIAVSAGLAVFMNGPEPAASFAYRLWKGLIFCIDWVVTRLVCLFLYYVIFTPLGLGLRLFRVRLLKMKPDSAADSYWREQTGTEPTPASYLRQY